MDNYVDKSIIHQDNKHLSKIIALIRQKRRWIKRKNKKQCEHYKHYKDLSERES